jgi:DegV family protein with EDD domain
MPIAIVTDSCAYLPAELAQHHDIGVVSLSVHVDGESIPETQISDYGAYFRRLAHEGDLPTTSQPSIGDFLAVYEPLIATGHQIASLHLAGAMSGTVQTAELARRALGADADRVRVIDTRVACAAEALMAQAAVKVAQRGGDFDAIAARVEELRQGLDFWFTVDSLEYLRRGGRIGGAQAWLGTALQIRPILSLTEGITPVERVRTTRRAFARIVSLLEQARENGADGWAVQHVQAPENAQALVERGRQIFGSEPLIFSEIGPVIGTHVGPGFFGAGACQLALLS